MDDHRDRQCVMCIEFVTSDHKLMKRHVAIIHGDSTFSTLQCGICKRKYYDFDHFQDHVNETPSCLSDSFRITPVPLVEPLERAFLSLVDQMMKPVHIQSAQFIPNAALSSDAANLDIGGMVGESSDQMQSPTLSNSQSCSSSVKKPFEDVTVPCNNESPKIISVKSLADQGRFVDQTATMQDISLDTAAQMDVQHQEGGDSVEEDGLEAFLEREALRSIERQAHHVEGVANQVSTIDDSGPKSGQNTPRISVDQLRQQCRRIISERSHEGSLTCSLCNASVAIGNEKGASHVLNHIRIHMETPLFSCHLCTFKSKLRSDISRHIFNAHNATFDQNAEKIGDYIALFMRMINQCFDHDMQRESNGNGQLAQSQMEIDQEKAAEKRRSTSIFDEAIEGDGMDQETEEVGTVQSIIEENNGQEELQRKPSEADLRLHCRKIIRKRQQKGRLTCSVCKGSIVVVDRGYPKHRQALDHAQYHLSPSLFACNSCDFKSNHRHVMRRHVVGKHSSDRYIDTTADRIDELMQLATRCFDYGLRDGNHQQEIANSGTGQTISNGDCGSAAQPRRVSTMVGGLKLRISVSKGTDCRNSNGPKGRKRLFAQPRKSRYTIGRTKQGGFSVTLEKKNLGTRLSTTSNTRLPKLVPEPESHELNDKGIKQRLDLPPHIQDHKKRCSKLAQKFIKDGKLECKLCQQLITVSQHERRASKSLRMQNGYHHAMTVHMHDVDLFECTTCDYRTSNQTAIYSHVAHIHNRNQRNFIDHRAKHYQKILQMFLACYIDEKSVPLTSAHGIEGHRNERIVGRKPGRKNTKFPPHILKARHACYDRVKAFIKKGKLYCQLCPQWIVVAYPTRNNIASVMKTAIAHATTHIEGCHLFECSTCHIVTRTQASMYDHARKYHKGGQAKFLDRSNQYYQKILNQFVACFDLENSGETTPPTSAEQGTRMAGGGSAQDDKMGNGCSAMEPKDSRQDQEIKSVCSKCGYKTAFQMLFRMHQKIMHAE